MTSIRLGLRVYARGARLLRILAENIRQFFAAAASRKVTRWVGQQVQATPFDVSGSSFTRTQARRWFSSKQPFPRVADDAQIMLEDISPLVRKLNLSWARIRSNTGL